MVLRLPDSWSNWNLEMLVFEEWGKPEYPEENLSEQRREPTTNSAHIWLNPQIKLTSEGVSEIFQKYWRNLVWSESSENPDHARFFNDRNLYDLVFSLVGKTSNYRKIDKLHRVSLKCRTSPPHNPHGLGSGDG